MSATLQLTAAEPGQGMQIQVAHWSSRSTWHQQPASAMGLAARLALPVLPSIRSARPASKASARARMLRMLQMPTSNKLLCSQ